MKWYQIREQNIWLRRYFYSRYAIVCKHEEINKGR